MQPKLLGLVSWVCESAEREDTSGEKEKREEDKNIILSVSFSG